jgi:hydroxymethylpyrimidine pyrophosphatase-like HAD family hydrolase
LCTRHSSPSWCDENLYDVHVTHLNATKRKAKHKLYEVVEVMKGETIGTGDSDNDIPLFESVGFGVAVRNGTDLLKRLADYVAPAQSDGALKYVIRRFLIEQLPT